MPWLTDSGTTCERLAPGATVTLPVTMTASTVGDPTLLELAADISSPWQDVATKTLGLAWTVTFAGGADLPAAGGGAGPLPRSGLADPRVWAVTAAGALALAITAGIRLARRPHLAGSLSIYQDGNLLHEVLLRGHTATLSGTPVPLSARLKPIQSTERGTGVQITATSGGASAAGTLFDGDELRVGNLSIRFTTERTRMMSLISAELP